MTSDGSQVPDASQKPDYGSENLDYLRRLYENVLDWYKMADSKAQLILTLDGVIIAFSSSRLLTGPDAAKLSGWGRSLAGAGALLLATGIYFAIDALHSYLTESDLRAMPGTEIIGNVSTYNPELLWWFGMIATLSRTPQEAKRNARSNSIAMYLPRKALLRRPPTQGTYYEQLEFSLQTVNANGERRALASQIVILSAHVLEKHRSVNRGWLASGAALVFILLSAIVSAVA